MPTRWGGFTAAIERDFDCEERRNMALARLTVAGENGVLCSGIMGGPKAIWARGGAGAKMGALKLKGILIQGEPPGVDYSPEYKKYNKAIGKKILTTSVIRNALKKVGTPSPGPRPWRAKASSIAHWLGVPSARLPLSSSASSASSA